MPIRFENPFHEVDQVLRKQKEQPFLSSLGPFLREDDPSVGATGTKSIWVRIAKIPLPKLKAAATLADAVGEVVAWRCVIAEGNGTALMATTDAQGNAVAGISRGPAADAAFAITRQLRKLPGTDLDMYKPWIIAIPTLYTEAFWLQSTTGQKDLVVPFLSHHGLRVGHTYDAATFLHILKAVADDPNGKLPGNDENGAARRRDRERELPKIHDPAEQRKIRIAQIRAKQQESDRRALAQVLGLLKEEQAE